MSKTELLQKTLYLLDRVDVPSEFSNLAELIEVELAKTEQKPTCYISNASLAHMLKSASGAVVYPDKKYMPIGHIELYTKDQL